MSYPRARRLVERPAVIVREPAPWEAAFLTAALARQAAESKRYPQQLLDTINTTNTVVEGGGGGAGAPAPAAGDGGKGGKKGGEAGEGKAKGGKGDAAAAGAAKEGDAAPPADGGGGAEVNNAAADALLAKPTSLAAFYEKRANASAADQGSNEGDFAVAPRTTPADSINDTRSLDRAYAHRLVLLVKRKADGTWCMPAGEAAEGEAMREAAERHLRATFAPDPDLDLWFVGPAPVGHRFVVHTAEAAAAAGSYGEKRFLYRAEILNGRMRPRADGPYADYAWVTRDEAEGLLPREEWKYVRQVMGVGPAEEATRSAAWLAKVEKRGLTVAQAAGRRSWAVTQRTRDHTRLRIVATAPQAALAAAPWSGGKEATVKAEVIAGFKREAEQRRVSAQWHAALARKSKADVHAAAWAARVATAHRGQVTAVTGGGAAVAALR